METGVLRDRVLGRFPLKPSLVEWKLLLLNLGPFIAAALETFLSGMETASQSYPFWHGISLETFLSGMET